MKKSLTLLLIIALAVNFACKKKKKNNDAKNILGKWIIYTTPEDLARMRTGRQKFIFVFNKNGKGVYYYYNIDYETGTQYNRKDKYFKYKLEGNKIVLHWKEDNTTDKWPYSFQEEGKHLVISDPSPGGQTFVLERAGEDE